MRETSVPVRGEAVVNATQAPKVMCARCGKRYPTPTPECPKCGDALQKKCVKCSIWIENWRSACPWCMASQTKQKSAPGNIVNIVIGFLCIGMVIFVVGGCFYAYYNWCAGTPKPPGPAVHNSEYDGSVFQVEQWLKKNLKDPDSFQAIEWSPVKHLDDGGWAVRCKYRAKNSFGGYVIENKLFEMNSTGKVTNSVDWF